MVSFVIWVFIETKIVVIWYLELNEQRKKDELLQFQTRSDVEDGSFVDPIDSILETHIVKKMVLFVWDVIDRY